MRNPSSQSNAGLYSNYLTTGRRSARWYEIRRLDAQQPPSYQEALCAGLSRPSFIRLPRTAGDFCSRNSYTNAGFLDEAPNSSLAKYLSDKEADKTGQVSSTTEFSELSVLDLQGVLLAGYELPSYEEAIKMDESNECTKL